MPTKSGLIDPAEAAVLLVDHQSGLLQIINHVNPRELRNNVATLAKAATLSDVPVIATASVPEGPNGPLLPEIFANAPKATYVRRQGQINAWDAEGFRHAVAQTGRRTLIIAGIMTSVCVVEPALSALAEGYDVYAVIDASGTYSDEAQRVSTDRMIQAGVKVVDVLGVAAEFQRTWIRDDAMDWAGVYAGVSPGYGAVIESVMRAQAEATGGEGAAAENKWAEARGRLV
ncbi:MULTISPECIES: isochorismatase family protein [unclassified Streptomyces]|uniref:isochorismatase family protein n=1 Tax=unclassified Streptomyces TaxID=2593676 RepID=UPI00039FCD89|nr:MULTISPECIES: isochorismatase family protein [unclassified Streptomyces]MYT33460.1 isochorismatase family protein [Streptomyces sp. SID8354]